MSHFAFIAPPFASHVRALEALAGVLIDRGHRVTWVHQRDVQPLLADARIGFRTVGGTTHPVGSLAAIVARAAKPGGYFGIRKVIDDLARATDMLCSEGPDALAALGVDAIVADQMEAAGGLVAEYMGLPYVSVACALPVNRELRIPLPVMPWRHAVDERGEKLNEHSRKVYDWLMRPHEQVVAWHAKAFGLGPRRRLDECLSPLAQLSQTTTGFDFPRSDYPPHFHHVGPLRPALPDEPALSPTPDPGKPFAYASLGTMQGGRYKLFRRIVVACRREGIQVMVAHCNGLEPRQAAALKRSGAFAVTGHAPQQAALALADVAITHAGLNTVMDALAAGTPMLTLPIAFDQAGVAARVLHAGAGVRLLPALASVRALRRALRGLLNDAAYTNRAQALSGEVKAAGGVALAADIVEAAVSLKRPILRTDLIADALAGPGDDAVPEVFIGLFSRHKDTPVPESSGCAA